MTKEPMSDKKSQHSDQSAAQRGARELKDSLWLLTAAPGIWAVHLILSYATMAVWCAKFAGRTGDLDGGRIAVAIYTAIALVALTLVGWRGIRNAGPNVMSVPHDKDTDDDRHRFLGLATVLLSGLSIVATIYVALPIIFIGSCR